MSFVPSAWCEAYVDHVPQDMVRVVRALIGFIYLAQRSIHDMKSFNVMQDAVDGLRHYFRVCWSYVCLVLCPILRLLLSL